MVDNRTRFYRMSLAGPRRAAYLIVGAAVWFALAHVTSTVEAGVVAVVQAEATVALAAAGIEAIAYNRDLVNQMRRQTELANRPWLVVTVESPNQQTPDLVIRNIGTGPATKVRVVGRTPGYEGRSEESFWKERAGIEAGGLFKMDYRWNPEPLSPGDLPLVAGFVDRVVAVRYSDWFDGTNRSVLDGGVVDVWKGDAWRDPKAPGWARGQRPG
jgi:hypothetical protein